jgi:hypothetical protein
VKLNRLLNYARQESIYYHEGLWAARHVAGAVLLFVVCRAVVALSLANDRAVISSGGSVVGFIGIHIACNRYPNATGWQYQEQKQSNNPTRSHRGPVYSKIFQGLLSYMQMRPMNSPDPRRLR